jgi:DNA polymerase-3 subunit delta
VKISDRELGAGLRRGLAPVYVVSGADPLLVDEAVDAIRQAARAAGYADRQQYTVDRRFDWNLLREAGASLSLFAERRLIELRFEWRIRDGRGVPPTLGDNAEEGVEVLVEYGESPPADTILLVVAPNLDKKTAAGRWVGALERAGVHVEVRAVGARELGRWIDARMRAAGLEPTGRAVALIAERVEGNLVAAAQEIEKLRLLRGAGPVDEDAVLDAVADSARFDVYKLVDAAFAGDAARALRVLEGLKGEGLEPPQIMWLIRSDLRSVAALAWEHKTRRRSKVASAMWDSRRRQLGAVQNRAELSDWHALVVHAAEVEGIVKGRAQGQPWAALTGLVAAIARTAAA